MGEEGELRRDITKRRLWLLAVIGALFIGALVTRRVSWGELTGWSVFFHGIPAILAILFALSGPRETLRGRVMFGVTIALLLAGIVVGEGFICIVIAAPFVYALAAGISTGIEYDQRRRKLGFILPGVIAMSFLSGFLPTTSLEARASIVTETATGVVAEQISRTPVIPPVDSGLMSLGFPEPVAVYGSGVEIGSERIVMFSDGGELVLRVTESDPGRVVFSPVADTTIFGEWITLEAAEFTWRAVDEGTSVSLVLSYERLLEPGWYFQPIVSMGVSQAADHLLNSFVG